MASTEPRIFALIMAAGRASRFGATKQLVEIDHVPLVSRAARTAREVVGERVLTIVGHDATAVLEALGSDAGFFVVNDEYDKGLSRSIAAGVRACREDADAALLLLADQPLVSARHLQALVGAWSGGRDEIVATAFAGTTGPPALFAAGAFDELESLSGDQGARALLQSSCFSVRSVHCEEAAVDIDTPGDLVALGKKPL